MKLNIDNFIFSKIKKLSSQLDLKVYVVGGFVRDFILKRQSKDIDFVVVGNGIDFAKKLAKSINPRIKVSTFKTYGTAMFKLGDTQYEFVGARKESYNKNSRNPIVEAGTLEDDLKRRDFTINALAVSLNKTNYGEVIDLFDGLQDLKDKRIVTPLDPNITYSDDPLRMIRAIRFASQLNFKIDKISFEAIKNNVNRIKIITNERISDELNKIVLSPTPSVGFYLLFQSGLLEIILPELTNLSGIEHINNVGHKDNFVHSLQVIDNISQHTDNLWLRWAALLHDIGKAKTKRFINNTWTFHAHQLVSAKMVKNIFNRLKLPQNEKLKYVQKIIEMHHRPTSIVDEGTTDSAIRRLVLDAGDDLNDLLTLVEADITTKNYNKLNNFLSNYRKLRRRIKEIEEKDFIRNWQPPIDGKEIMGILNIPPSKLVGELKNAIKNAILDEEIENTHQAAYDYLLKYYKNFSNGG